MTESDEAPLSPVPNFHPVLDDGADRNNSEKKLPEFDEQDYSSKLFFNLNK